MDEIITLSYGSGGKKTSELIEELLLPAFKNEELSKLSDGAILPGFDKLVMSTDSFVVNPVFFPGGDIGKLSVCGTVNDISVCGGVPKYLTLSFIIEEGFKTDDLKKIIESIKITAEKCNVKIVTGDTKVVEKGKGDGIYINTAGVGFLEYEGLGIDKIMEGDAVIVSGTMGDHGTAVMAARENFVTGVDIVSDCAPLDKLCQSLLKFKDKVKIMRDPTRGGLATTLNEFVEGTELSIELIEDEIPVNDKVMNYCEILGLDPLYSANEGKIIVIVDDSIKLDVINELKKFEEGKNATIIGKITSDHKGKVVLNTNIGGKRVLAKLTGAQLPRIC